MSEVPRAAIGTTAVFNERAQAWRDWQLSPGASCATAWWHSADEPA